jgi:hypothetical protein
MLNMARNLIVFPQDIPTLLDVVPVEEFRLLSTLGIEIALSRSADMF